jgi:16S rRNA (guanine1207-N2)-methyltransferase
MNKNIKAVINGVELIFETSPELFSPAGIDAGTNAMLSVAEFREDDKVLDLGCGYGVVGILAAKLIGSGKVTMSDSNPKAVEYTAKNAELNSVGGARIIQSDGFQNIDDKDYSLILSNPPYHENFNVPKAFIEKGFNRLQVGGRMMMVTKRETWYRNKLTAVFGGVRVRHMNGYCVFMSVKKGTSYANAEKQRKNLLH